MPSPAGPAGSVVRGRELLLVAAVVLAALNLRPAVTSVGPLLDAVRDDVGAGAVWASALTTAPVLCFAAAGLAAPALAARVGVRAAVGAALAALLAGLVLRVLGGAGLLLGATVLAAAGIAVTGVLLPVVVRTGFPTRIGLVTGLYTAALQAGATLGFALTPQLDAGLGGWRPALGAWAVVAALALAAWVGAGPRRVDAPAGAAPRRSLRRSPLAWVVTAFFGLQAFVAFGVMSWLALALIDAGVDRADAGLLLGLLSIVALPVSLTVPALAGRSGGQSGWIVALGACGLAGTTGFLVAPTAAPALWAVLLGLGMSVFSLALTVIALRARTGEDTAALSGMAQGLGYLLAAAGPFTIGLLHEATGGWSAPFVLLLVVIAAQTVVGAFAGRDRHV
jgi:MFS transporter, CP family, cyanate transporter